MSAVEYSMSAQTGGQSAKVAVSGTSAQSAIVGERSYAVVTPDVNVFFRRGSNPTAVVDVDQILLANQTYRLYGMAAGDKLAFVTAGAAGNVYITPGA